MDMNRFRELANAFGGDLDRWPEAERAAAEAWAAENAEAATILQDASELDALLAGAAGAPPSDLLARRILKSAPAGPFEVDWRRPAVAAAAALIVGVVSGFTGGLFLPNGSDPYYESEYADAFDGLVEDWSAWDWSDA
jgi:ferric-dicitrate binding protein FerR (iron transport regulator)